VEAYAGLRKAGRLLSRPGIVNIGAVSVHLTCLHNSKGLISNALGEGITGSGKKDFCLRLLDEAALDGGALNRHRSEGIHHDFSDLTGVQKGGLQVLDKRIECQKKRSEAESWT